MMDQEESAASSGGRGKEERHPTIWMLAHCEQRGTFRLSPVACHPSPVQTDPLMTALSLSAYRSCPQCVGDRILNTICHSRTMDLGLHIAVHARKKSFLRQLPVCHRSSVTARLSPLVPVTVGTVIADRPPYRVGRPRLWRACRCIEIALLPLWFVRAYLLALLIRRRRCREIDRVWRLFLDLFLGACKHV